MITNILLFLCATLVLVPILATQIPRYVHYRRSRNAKPISNSPPSRKRSEPTELYHFPIPSNRSRPMTDGSDTPTSTPASKASRRPWDPPFPVSDAPRREGEWLVLPPSESRRGLTPPALKHENKHENKHEDRNENQEHREERELTPSEALPPNASTNNTGTRKEVKGIMAIMWIALAVLAGILLVLGTVVLLIHCLAWFIVYQTEARLGEARRGLLMSGEMRLCLCGRG